jgi:hypothetical protein
VTVTTWQQIRTLSIRARRRGSKVSLAHSTQPTLTPGSRLNMSQSGLAAMKRSWSGHDQDIDSIKVAPIPKRAEKSAPFAKVNESRLNVAQAGTSDSPLDLRTPSPEKKHGGESTSCSASELGEY